MKRNNSLFFAAILTLWSCTGSSSNDSIIEDGAKLTLISDDFSFTEGPASDRKGDVYFTDQPNNRIYRWSEKNGISLYLDSAGRSNGLFVDDQGNLLACADLDNELWKVTADKSPAVLVKGFKGEKLNGPNDLWLAADGGIYFTDPFYLRSYWTDTSMMQRAKRVFYLAPGEEFPRVEDSTLVQPNGIIGTSNGKLYVADIHGGKTYEYRIGNDGNLVEKKEFVSMGSDGMTVDDQGNVYLTGDGVTVFDSLGNQIEHIAVPEKWTANVTFGGKDQQTLFITASKSVYTLRMNVRGTRW